ncbi:hypothetical protein [Pseudoneobacillus sp. C159]
MLTSYILSLFLYFPEDKSEYFPAVLTMIVFLILAVFTMLWIIKYSKKEAEKTRALEESLLKQIDEKNHAQKNEGKV